MTRRLTLALVALLALPVCAQALERQFYVSLGDSYATGYQPSRAGRAGGSSGQGFADQLPDLARKRGYRLALRNFGCGGATTTSLLRRPGCPWRARGKRHAVRYRGRTQVDAAARFLRRHRGRTALVTVAIAGNDVNACARAKHPVACARGALTGVDANLEVLLRRLRRAAGPAVRIVGLTYPDVFLGGWISGRKADRVRARRSQVIFETVVNPLLRARYRAVDGSFVDVTDATHGYDSLGGSRTGLPGSQPYRLVPLPVARICALTWYCGRRDIHANRSGYRLIARLVSRRLPDRG